MRHPHPTEVALLNGVPVPDNRKIQLKLALAGLGQQCAPFHIVWLASQIKAFVERLHYGTSQVDCNKLLDTMRDEILLQSRTLFGRVQNHDMNVHDEIPCVSPPNPSPHVRHNFSHDGGRDWLLLSMGKRK